MLGRNYRLHVYWVGDETLTFDSGAVITISMTPYRTFTDDLYNTVINDDFTFDTGITLATLNSREGAVQINSSNKAYGAKGTLRVIADVSGTLGTMYLYIEWADTNSVTLWPSDQDNFDVTKDLGSPVAALTVDTDAVDESQSQTFTI